MSTHGADPFREALIAAGILIPATVRGGYGRGEQFANLLEAFDRFVLREAAADGAEAPVFPPIVARSLIEQLGYLDNFPHLVGSVHSFEGTEAEARAMADRARAGERWEAALRPTEVTLLPAACYPVYPALSGALPEGGRLVTVRNWCYRHEPSDEVTRLQSFQMREYVLAGAAVDVLEWRNSWLGRAERTLTALGLPIVREVASDPFFGRTGRLMAASQREQQLKFELLVPILAPDRPTAICSFNWHQEHFSGKFELRLADGRLAQTACVGFGLERVTLALLHTHGLDIASWPTSVRALLWPEGR